LFKIEHGAIHHMDASHSNQPIAIFTKEFPMGRGDIKTRKGKIFAGSFGNKRKRGKHQVKTSNTPKR
jgi:ribosomal small subunit protein bTHX